MLESAFSSEGAIKDERKTKKELIDELQDLRSRVAELEAAAAADPARKEEHSRVEAALRDREARLSSILRAAPVGIATLRDRVFSGASEHFCRLVGYSVDELMGQTTRIMYPSEAEFLRVGNDLYPQLERGDVGLIEAQLQRSDGSQVDAAISGAWLEPDRHGGELLILVLDITELKRTKGALRESEETIRSIVETSQDWIWSIDREGVNTYTNSAVERILGYSVERVIGAPVLALIHEEDRGDWGKALRVGVAEKRGWRNLIARWRHKEGGYRILESNAVPIIDPDGRLIGFRGVDRDVTERKEAEDALRESEERLYRAQKMESLGLLAGGVAHEFNNLLTLILGHAELVGVAHDESGLSRDSVDAIVKAGTRAAELTHRLLAFSRSQVFKPRVVDLNQVMLGTDGMLRRLIGADVELVAIPSSDLDFVKVDPGQVEQLLVNLAVNARDAMPRGGRLKLETRKVWMGQEEAESEGLNPGPYAVIDVSDNGTGMTEELLSRIFEPLFSTKERGRGTGLGLAICNGIVRQSGGHISVESEPGVGTTFTVYFPGVEGDVEELEEGLQPPSPSTTGCETILLVDDDSEVRDLAATALRESGYNVLEASYAAEALDAARQTEDIDLLITDMVLPKMSGVRLAELMSSDRPKLKVLYISGYTPSSAYLVADLDPATTFLAKPFTPSLLANRVREVLDG